MSYIELEIAKQLKDMRKCYSKVASSIDDSEEVSSNLIRTALRFVKWYADLIEKSLSYGERFNVKHLRELLDATETLAGICENKFMGRKR